MAKSGVSDDIWHKFVAFSAGFYDNLSNYTSSGFNKFAPDMTKEEFKGVLLANPLYGDEKAFYREVVDEMYT